MSIQAQGIAVTWPPAEVRQQPASGRAAIIGGSIAGLFAAVLLRRRGWDVRVFERATEALSARGAGIVTHPQLDRALELAGVGRPDDFGVLVHDRRLLARSGAVEASYRYKQTMTAWDRLWRLLRDALPEACFVAGAEFAALEQDARRVRARFLSGDVVEADLLLGADGLRSSVREAVVGAVRPVYAGYAAWRGLVAEAALPSAARTALFGSLAFCLPPGEQMVGYPVAGPENDLRPGHRRYNWVWYRPGDPAALLRDRHGQLHAVSIPPPLIRPELVEAMRAASERLLAPAFAAAVAATERPFLQPIYDLESPRLAVGRVALLGDAAFVARPHVGAGATKAAEDALALAEALDGTPVPEALAGYETARRMAGRRLLRRARHLGAYLQAEQNSDEERSAAARHHTSQAVLAETAVLDF